MDVSSGNVGSCLVEVAVFAVWHRRAILLRLLSGSVDALFAISEKLNKSWALLLSVL